MKNHQRHTYPEDFETKIGFDGVRRVLSALCQSQTGKRHVDAMCFSVRRDHIKTLLCQTAEMAEILRADADIPSDTIYDISPSLMEAKVEGSFLTATAFYRLLQTLNSLAAVRKFFCGNHSVERPAYPALSECFEKIEPFPAIASEIDAIIDRFGEIRDTASPKLHELRRSIASASASMSSVMQRVMDRAVASGAISKDTAPTMRDGRLCIPVEAAQKRSVGGIVHDRSATGKTIFIEPAELVEAGNRLRELEIEEQREQVVILTSLTASIRPHIEEITESVELLGLFDFIRAKARFALDVDGQMPVIERRIDIDWFHAVHPMLLLSLRKQGREIVPLNLRLDSDRRILIISGPNAGGKSVCLKTVGIVQYMMQCGLLPTLHSNSHMSVFDKIFIDIGDEQSLENDLSTYSSHLRNMKHFLLNADDKTLVLADEMGSGTEPQIGGALAQAILMKLNDKSVTGIITTHYQNLKTLADNTPGFVNGAMLYDRQHLRPLFQLSVGSPGSSFALEIASKTGLPKDVVESAKEIVGSEYVEMDKYLLDIARDRKYWNNKRLSIKEKEQKLDKLLSSYEENSGNLRQQRAAILREAREEAKEILSTANAKIERAILEIRQSEAEKERTKSIRRELEEYKKTVSSDNRNDENVPKILKPLRHKSRTNDASVTKPKEEKKEIRPGDYVKMADGGVAGKVLSISGKKAEVAFGSLRTFASIDKLKHASAPKTSAQAETSALSSSTYNDSRERQLRFKTELDVRGMRGEEALQALTYFLDDALQFSASRVRILHGTGHGILRELIRQQLRATPGVTSFADEDVRFGGAGITVVELN